MARYTATITSPHSAATTWSYLADLRSTVEWDPSVDEARLVSGEPGTLGAGYQLEVGFLGKGVTVPYVTVALVPARVVVFSAETESVTVRDEARVRPVADGGSCVVWEAEVRLKGLRRFFDPLLGLAFNRLGRSAKRGLEERLNEHPLMRLAEVPA